MANVLALNGFFGVKQAFHVSDPSITTTWTEGQLFMVDEIGSSGAGDLKGAVGARGPFVALSNTSGAAITGVALEGSDEATTAVSGMQHPSGSKVTLLHGHSSFFITYNGTNTTATDRQAGGAPWEDELESASLMDTLYASVNGLFTDGGGKTGMTDTPNGAVPIGYLSQVPAAANDWTIGVVLFG